MTMTTLTGQPAGWFLFNWSTKDQWDDAGEWDGTQFVPARCSEPMDAEDLTNCTNFRRLIEAPEPEQSLKPWVGEDRPDCGSHVCVDGTTRNYHRVLCSRCPTDAERQAPAPQSERIVE